MKGLEDVAAWLTAHGFDPGLIPRDSPIEIIVQRGGRAHVRVTVYVLNEEGKKWIGKNDEIVTETRVVPLLEFP